MNGRICSPGEEEQSNWHDERPGNGRWEAVLWLTPPYFPRAFFSLSNQPLVVPVPERIRCRSGYQADEDTQETETSLRCREPMVAHEYEGEGSEEEIEDT